MSDSKILKFPENKNEVEDIRKKSIDAIASASEWIIFYTDGPNQKPGQLSCVVNNYTVFAEELLNMVRTLNIMKNKQSHIMDRALRKFQEKYEKLSEEEMNEIYEEVNIQFKDWI